MSFLKRLFDVNSVSVKNIASSTININGESYTGSSVIDYLISKRIEVSKKLLQATDLPIYEIGNQVGISNNTHFIQTFKNIHKYIFIRIIHKTNNLNLKITSIFFMLVYFTNHISIRFFL